MDKTFSSIKQLYEKRHTELFLKSEAQRTTKLGYWAASETDTVFELFTQIGLSKYKQFLDLGSGDGVVVAIASLFTDATGIEIDEKLHDAASADRKSLKLEYTLKNKDYLEEDFSQYDIIFINPDNHFYKLEKKITEEFSGTLIVVENIFRPLLLKPNMQIEINAVKFCVYNIKNKNN